MAIWLAKTEAGDYSLADLRRDGSTAWDGVSNPLALRHMRAMQPGDRVLIYHTGRERAIVGIAEVVRAAYQDAAGETVVDVAFRAELARPVTLAEVKEEPGLAGWELVRLSRLSVMPVPPEAWAFIARLSGLPLSQ